MRPFDLQLAGRTAVVVGGSSGIGASTAIQLAASGANIVLVGRNRARLDAVAERCSVADVSVSTYGTDLTVRGAADDVAARVIESGLAVDIVVNCAAGDEHVAPTELAVDSVERSLRNKFLLGVSLLSAFIPAMVARNDGVILWVAGVGGVRPFPSSLPGGTANAAIVLYCKGLGRSLGPHGVRVLAFSPGLTQTDLLDEIVAANAERDGVDRADARSLVLSGIPLGRPASAEEVADAICFFVSPRAGYFTASHIIMDGGQVEAT